jgi:peptidoglycan/LPS O-acetylase OafA/YrhL
MGNGTAGDRIFKGHILELDGFRACGLVMVVSAHSWPKEQWPLFYNWLSMSWIAMDAFFVLSGFLIAGILLDTRHRTDYYSTYYVRRTLRIFPIYYCVMIALIAGMALWHGGEPYAEFTRVMGSPLWFLFYMGNISIALAGCWAPVEAFSPLWSLQVEEQFYLLLPLAIRRVRLETLYRILWLVVFLSPVVRLFLFWWNPGNPFLQYVLLPCRAEGLALGALLAVRFRMGPWNIGKRRLTGLTLVLLAAAPAAAALGGYTWNRPFNRTLGYFLSSVACASVLLWLIQFRNSRATRLLRSRPLVYLGKISYGAYVLHVPVREAVAFALRNLSWHLPGGDLLRVPLCVGLSIASASLSWYILEGPLMRLKDKLVPLGASASAPSRQEVAQAA